MLRNLRTAGLALVIAGGLGGCESATDVPATRQLELVNPEILRLSAPASYLAVRPRQAGVYSGFDPDQSLIEGYPVVPGTLWVQALPPRGTMARAGTRIEVTARTSHGDVERFSLRGREWVCETQDTTHCFRFWLRVATVEQAYALEDRLPGIGGRFLGITRHPVSVSRPEEFVAVDIAIPEASWESAMRQAKRWPNVQSAHYHVFFTQWRAWQDTGYTGGLPVEFAEPTAGDGILQLEPGVEITMEYRQPDGSVLVSTLEY